MKLQLALDTESLAAARAVLAVAETVTIRRACEAAKKARRAVMADLIAVAEPARRNRPDTRRHGLKYTGKRCSG